MRCDSTTPVTLLQLRSASRDAVSCRAGPVGNVWNTNLASARSYQFDPIGSVLATTAFSPESARPGGAWATSRAAAAAAAQQPGLLVLARPGRKRHDRRSRASTARKCQFSLLRRKRQRSGHERPGATNYTAGLNNFVAPADGTYYIAVTGDPGAQFNLVVTRGADFTTQPHTTLATAQDITATEQSGDNKLGGALGSLQNPSGAFLGTTIEGIDFNGSNCGCLPPDTNAAVGNGFVAETVNVQFRVWDTSGNICLMNH